MAGARPHDARDARDAGAAGERAGAAEEPAWKPEHRLVVYGTLRPGGENHALVADLGEWEPVTLVGHLGSWYRYPAFIPDPAGAPIPADLVTSARLPARWRELDDFEGPGYRRVVVDVDTARGWIRASCYVLADDR